MKKVVWTGMLVLSLVLAIAASGFSAPVEGAKKITLSFCHLWPANSYQQVDQFSGYFKMLEARLGGKYAFDIKYYPMGTLLNGPDIYQGVVNGVVDIAAGTPVFQPQRFLAHNAINQAGVAPRKNCGAGSRINQEFFEIYKHPEFNDVKMLYCWGNTPELIFSVKPIKTLEDIKGLPIRTSGPSAVTFKTLGATPVSMDMGETLAAAQKGIVQAAFGPAEMLKNYNLPEVFRYATYTPFLSAGNLFVIMNKAKFNALPADVQKALDDITWPALAEAAAIWDYNEKMVFDWAKKAPKGHEIISMSDQEQARWKELLKGIPSEYAAKLNAAGLPGAEMIKNLGELTAKYNVKAYEPWNPGTPYKSSVLKLR